MREPPPMLESIVMVLRSSSRSDHGPKKSTPPWHASLGLERRESRLAADARRLRGLFLEISLSHAYGVAWFNRRRRRHGDAGFLGFARVLDKYAPLFSTVGESLSRGYGV
jgi:hypothetical protein